MHLLTLKHSICQGSKVTVTLKGESLEIEANDTSVSPKQGYYRKSDKGGKLHIREILGGNMKTHVAVYEEGLFDLRGAKLFKGGQMPPLAPPPPPPKKKPCKGCPY